MSATQTPIPESCGHRGWNCSLGQHNRRFVLTRQCHHLLLMGHRHRATFFSIRPGNAFVGFRLVNQQIRSDIFTDTDVCDIYRDNLKCRL
jgi:hypothetical protein